MYTREKDSSNPYGYTEDKQPFKDYTVAKWGKSYKLNNVYYDVIRKDNGYQGRYYDPYLVMLTNGEIISLYP
ncbi:hypothetical protein SDC9_211704 [bioreactor metagenome]|uniref:Uncharacterized protein n=1 Tax=bioreactor metagenome TaxID=1076179 RepID=A0A645JKQ7_9ZZZZ